MSAQIHGLDKNERKELFSYAYIQAVCASAGLAVDRPNTDLDSRDLRIYCRGAAEFYAQVKCTENLEEGTSQISYPLPISDYDNLRQKTVTPTILIVVHVPHDPMDWVGQSERELALRRCAYWVSPLEWPETQNVASVTVHLPKEQMFSQEAPWAILRGAGFRCDV